MICKLVQLCLTVFPLVCPYWFTVMAALLPQKETVLALATEIFFMSFRFIIQESK